MRGFELKELLQRDGDGTKRPLRPVQIEAFEWIGDNFDSGDHLIIRAPTGSGKSLIIKALQIQLGCPVINNKNVLLDQNSKDYPTSNYYKGKAHYKCESHKSGCAKAFAMFPDLVDEKCSLWQSRNKADMGEPTYFNPMSYWHFLKRNHQADLGTVVIDEAHSVLSQLRNLSNISFKLKPDDLAFMKRHSMRLRDLTVYDILEWYYWKSDSLKLSYKALSTVGAKMKLQDTIDRLELVMTCVVEESEKYSYYIENSALHIQSINVSRALIKKMFPGRIILLSGTMFSPDLKEFIGNEHHAICNLESPIPKENRPVMFLPTPFRLNHLEMNYEKLVEEIESDILTFCPKGNVIVHVTYEMSERMLNFWTLKNIVTHTKSDKDAKLERFISKGGVLIAAGCEEGLDLKGDLCHLNIIAKVRWPNIGDTWVKKRRARYGDLWYVCETLKTVIQSAGRSTRSASDRSLIIVKDPSFSALRAKARDKKQMPEWFEESIIALRARKVKDEFSRLPYEGNGEVRAEVYKALWSNSKRGTASWKRMGCSNEGGRKDRVQG